jgi:hypothetical protein
MEKEGLGIDLRAGQTSERRRLGRCIKLLAAFCTASLVFYFHLDKLEVISWLRRERDQVTYASVDTNSEYFDWETVRPVS